MLLPVVCYPERKYQLLYSSKGGKRGISLFIYLPKKNKKKQKTKQQI